MGSTQSIAHCGWLSISSRELTLTIRLVKAQRVGLILRMQETRLRGYRDQCQRRHEQNGLTQLMIPGAEIHALALVAGKSQVIGKNILSNRVDSVAPDAHDSRTAQLDRDPSQISTLRHTA